MVILRSLLRAARHRSSNFSVAVSSTNFRHLGSRKFFAFPSSNLPQKPPSDGRSPFAASVGSFRCYSEDVSHMPVIKDPEIHSVFKDLMAENWDELPYYVVQGAKRALSKNTDDKSGQEILGNVFRSAEAVEEFTGILTSLKMEIDDSIGLSGEDVKPLPEYIASALRTAYQRYEAYLNSFGPDEVYLKKKVETELGTKMIHLKMRCSGLGSEWGKVTVLGTSGISGSYVEQRAR